MTLQGFFFYFFILIDKIYSRIFLKIQNIHLIKYFLKCFHKVLVGEHVICHNLVDILSRHLHHLSTAWKTKKNLTNWTRYKKCSVLNHKMLGSESVSPNFIACHDYLFIQKNTPLPTLDDKSNLAFTNFLCTFFILLIFYINSRRFWPSLWHLTFRSSRGHDRIYKDAKCFLKEKLPLN